MRKKSCKILGYGNQVRNREKGYIHVYACVRGAALENALHDANKPRGEAKQKKANALPIPLSKYFQITVYSISHTRPQEHVLTQFNSQECEGGYARGQAAITVGTP